MEDPRSSSGEKARKIETAISYRLCVYVINNHKIGDYGTEIGSEGYRMSKEKFEKEFKNINFEDMHNELILESLAEIKKTWKEKKKYTEMSGISDEGLRKVYNSVYETKKNKREHTTYDDNARNIKESPHIEDDIVTINDAFEKVLEQTRNLIKNRDKYVEYEELDFERIIESLKNISDMKYKMGFEDLEDDDFLETALRGSINYMHENELEKGKYNSLEESIIKEVLSKRKGNLEQKAESRRARSKETIYERLDKGTLSKISQVEFEEGYVDMLVLREGMIDDNKNIDRYALEQELNLSLYTNVAEEIVSLGIKKRDVKSFIEEITDLLVYSNGLLDNEYLSKVLNSKVSKDEKEYQEYIEELKCIFELRKKIINSMPKYEYEKSLDTMIPERVKERLQDVEIRSEYLIDNLESVESTRKLEVIRLLFERNNEVLRLRELAKKDSIGII